MQPKRSPLLLATGLLGVLAMGGLAFFFLKPGDSGSAPNPAAAMPTPTSAPTMRWVALNNIPPRTRVTTQMLTRVPYTAKEGVPMDGIKDISDINGEITNEPIMQGQPITLASFTPGIKRATPANIEIPSGTRAVAVFVDPSSTAAGLVDVGDFVDVIAVHKLSWDKGKNQAVVGALQFSTGRLIGSNLQVLAVEESLTAPPPTPTAVPAAPGASADAPPPTPTPPPPPAAAAPLKIRVLLAAPVDIATRLVAAGDQGILHITIRNPMDGDKTAAPEAREYPSRLINLPPDKTENSSSGGNSSSGSKRDRESLMPPMPAMTVPTLPPPTIPAQPERPTGPPMPVGPRTTDITVIRGTEKTRVIVPQR